MNGYLKKVWQKSIPGRGTAYAVWDLLEISKSTVLLEKMSKKSVVVNGGRDSGWGWGCEGQGKSSKTFRPLKALWHLLSDGMP